MVKYQRSFQSSAAKRYKPKQPRKHLVTKAARQDWVALNTRSSVTLPCSQSECSQGSQFGNRQPFGDDYKSEQDDIPYHPRVKIAGIAEPCLVDSFTLQQKLCPQNGLSHMQSYAVKLLITKPKGPSYRIESISDLVDKFGDNTDPAFALRCELVKKYEKDYSSYHRNERLPSNMCVSCQSTSFLSCQKHNHPYCLYCYQSSKNAVASNSKYMSLPVMDNCPCDSRTTVHRQKSMFCSMFQLFPSREINSFVSFATSLNDSILCGGYQQFTWKTLKFGSKNHIRRLQEILEANTKRICETGARRIWHIFAFHTRSNMVCFGDNSENSTDAFLCDIIHPLHKMVSQFASASSEHLCEMIGCDLEAMLPTLLKSGNRPNQFMLIFTKSSPFDDTSKFTSILRKYWHDFGMSMLEAFEHAQTYFCLESALLIQFLDERKSQTIFRKMQEGQDDCLYRQHYLDGVAESDAIVTMYFRKPVVLRSAEINTDNTEPPAYENDATTYPHRKSNLMNTNSPSIHHVHKKVRFTIPKGVCQDFWVGNCHRGNKCRFDHVLAKYRTSTPSRRS